MLNSLITCREYADKKRLFYYHITNEFISSVKMLMLETQKHLSIINALSFLRALDKSITVNTQESSDSLREHS